MSEKRPASKRKWWIAFGVSVLFVIVVWLIPVYPDYPNPNYHTLKDAKTIGLACKLYAGDNDGRYPATLCELVPKYLPDEKFIHSPNRPLGEDYEFEYFGGSDTDNPEKILIRGKLPGGKWVVLHSDQSAWIASNSSGTRK